LVLVIALVSVCPLLGSYMAATFGDGPAPGDRWFGPVERRIYRLIGAREETSQRWPAYVGSVLALSLVTTIGLYAALRLQGRLPFNPTPATLVTPVVTLVTAAASTVVEGETTSQPGANGLTEILYAAASATNGNGRQWVA
jgi:potassium-transporting ATPase potassium-binding subunit